MPVQKASEALAWLTDEPPERVLHWCTEHKEPVWVYNDGSWACWWQAIVETSDETQCVIVDTIPTEVLMT